jgi:hypothetical protein
VEDEEGGGVGGGATADVVPNQLNEYNPAALLVSAQAEMALAFSAEEWGSLPACQKALVELAE